MWGKSKVPTDRRRLGRWGEEQAERFLRRRKWKPIARNVAYKSGEIDLVMVDPDGVLVFIEVKTRQSETFQPVETVITETKKKRIRCATHCFLKAYASQEYPCRYDVVVVVAPSTGRPDIRHYVQAFND